MVNVIKPFSSKPALFKLNVFNYRALTLVYFSFFSAGASCFVVVDDDL